MEKVAKKTKPKKVVEKVVEQLKEEATEIAEVIEIEVPTPQTIAPVDNSVEGFINAAIAQQLPIETIKEFLVMRKELRADQAREAFTIAMASFQKDCPVIAKTKAVKNKSGEITYRYASIDSIILQVKGVLGENRLSYKFREERGEGDMTVFCVVTHAMGHSEETGFTVEIGTESFMTDTQKYGARNTFAKRYAFTNALGIVTGDEDTDAREIKTKLPPAPLNPKAKIISLLRQLGVTDTKEAEATRQVILDKTQLEPSDENIEEITSRLEVLVSEMQNESN
jgi:hypothetical protein